MEKIEKQIRAYVNSIKLDPMYKKHVVEWCFGAIDFCHSSGLIDSGLANSLLEEYCFLDAE